MNAPQPPIPSPVSDDTQPKSNYAMMLFCGIAVFAALLGLSRIIVAPVLFAAVALPLFLAAIAGTFGIKRAGEQLSYQLRSPGDLEIARKAIHINMKLAFAFSVLMYPLLGMVLMRRVWPCVIIVAIFTVPFGAWSTQVEAKFKAMTSDDESLNARFQDLLRRWKEPGFGLKRDA